MCVLLAFFIISCKSIWCLLTLLSVTPKYLKFSTVSEVQFFIVNCPIYIVLNCISVPLLYILFLFGLCIVLTFWPCFLFLQKVVLVLFHFFQLVP